MVAKNNTALGNHYTHASNAFGRGQEFEFAELGGVIQVPRSFESGYSERSAVEDIPTEALDRSRSTTRGVACAWTWGLLDF